MIPEAAVEAAWTRVANYFDDTEAESWKDVLRHALEAAAPFIAAAGFERGYVAAIEGAAK